MIIEVAGHFALFVFEGDQLAVADFDGIDDAPDLEAIAPHPGLLMHHRFPLAMVSRLINRLMQVLTQQQMLILLPFSPDKFEIKTAGAIFPGIEDESAMIGMKLATRP